MSVSQQIAAQLQRIAAEFVEAVQHERGELPTAVNDPEWRSKCIESKKNAELVYWRPVKRGSRLAFGGLEEALEQSFPPELAAFYGHLWSASLPVRWEDREFELLQLWNSEDQNNLMHNILGHALEKKRVREDLTLFFAVVDDARFLSCDLKTGAVLLEEVGRKEPRQVADGLLELLRLVSGTAGSEPPPAGE